ncbi:MAG: aquaporin [Deltaproteobacteria bacterium]|nr:aquaporin [Deltaproteobacteria bacterium]
MKHATATYFGEFLGTFILVFFGTSAVAVAVLFHALVGLFQVAAVWGLGVTLAIYATRHLSCAHLNPAVTLGMVLAGRMRPRLLLPYWASQLLGAAAAGVVVLAVFGGAIAGYEAAQGIVRGAPESVRTAMIFGEYFPNPGVGLAWFTPSLGLAMAVEGLGAFLLVTMIFLLTEGCNVGRPSEGASPVFIGFTVAVLICVFAPFTQTGINPARDLGPRLVAWLAGWGAVAIPGPHGGFFWVYILAPLLGGAAASAFFRWAIVPFMVLKAQALNLCACQQPAEPAAPGLAAGQES